MPPKKKGGRYTPKGGTPPKNPAPSSRAGDTRAPGGREAQVGRRPSPPWFLFLIGALWLAAGLVVAVRVEAAWKIVPGLVFVGIGFFYLRAALQTVVRREAHRDDGDDGHSAGA